MERADDDAHGGCNSLSTAEDLDLSFQSEDASEVLGVAKRVSGSLWSLEASPLPIHLAYQLQQRPKSLYLRIERRAHRVHPKRGHAAVAVLA